MLESLIMRLVSEAENEYLEIREKSIKEIVKRTLKIMLDTKKITNAEYQSALVILEKYQLRQS